jgi:DNA recombination protein RmuC
LTNQILLYALIALLALAVGAWLAYPAGRRRGLADAEPRCTGLARDFANAQSQREELEKRQLRLEAQLELARTTLAQAESQAAEVAARMDEQQRAHGEKLLSLQDAETRLRETFRNLATQILDERAQKLSEQSQQQIGGLIDPLKLQLKEFRDAITQTYANEQRERGMLSQEIQTLKQLNQQISEDAINLTRALKGDSRTQGAWGEMVLERVLEASGLCEGREFELQIVFADEDGSRPRPDVIVHLPENKDLVIDAKVSLTAYDRLVAANDNGEREVALREHAASFRRHIDGLSKRDYSSLPGLRTLDFVLLFVPIEPAFIEAIRADDGLYTYALSKNIALVSPSTLLATLRTVAHLWRLEDRNLNAAEIARQAGALYDSFVMLEQELAGVGDALDKAVRSHEGAVKRISTGKGNLLGRVERLRKLGADSKKQLPLAKLLEAESESEAGE